MSSSSKEVIMTINKHAEAQIKTIRNWGKGIEAQRKYTTMKMGFEFGLKYRWKKIAQKVGVLQL